jgi:hypothetical protein
MPDLDSPGSLTCVTSPLIREFLTHNQRRARREASWRAQAREGQNPQFLTGVLPVILPMNARSGFGRTSG